MNIQIGQNKLFLNTAQEIPKYRYSVFLRGKNSYNIGTANTNSLLILRQVKRSNPC